MKSTLIYMKKRQNKGIIQVYTDGAYDWESGVGGYGAVIFMNKGGKNRMRKFSSNPAYVDTTNNRMEIRAILACLKQIDPGYDIDIYTDSTYCELIMKKILDRFTYTPKVNKDLWNKVAKEVKHHRTEGSWINVSWIRGHSGNPFNEMADKLANKGQKALKKVVCDQNFHENKEARKNKKKQKWVKY